LALGRKVDSQTVLQALGRSPIHPFPARMAPGIALEALGKSGKSLRVLDPMVGSGTVLAVARANGHQALGFDVDPLAVLLAKVWTTTVEFDTVQRVALQTLQRAKAIFCELPASRAYPKGCDKITKKFIRYWFDTYCRRQLTALAKAIGAVKDPIVRDVLWCGFSRLIITKSGGASLAMDLSHSRPHREYDRAPTKPFNKFLSAVETVASNCPSRRAGKSGPRAVVKAGDARALVTPSRSVDLVLTSPPYLNAIDYLRCSKFTLVWMGYSTSELREIRAGSVGTEVSSRAPETETLVKQIIRELRLTPQLSSRSLATLAQYVWDMHCATAEVFRVLKSGGRAVYVVGDSTVRGTFIRNSTIVAAVARRNGLTLTSRHSRKLPENRRYMPPPRGGRRAASMDTRMRREVILQFEK
jgi:DNA modification methylase